MKYDVILPVEKNDINTALKAIKHIKDNLQPSRIVIITSDEVVQSISYDNHIDYKDIIIMSENDIIEGLNYDKIYNYLKKYNAEKRTGWYLQQFIKMAYSFITESKYYLSWDADTILLRRLMLFDSNNRPYFSLKDEFNEPYFKTINNLFGYKKNIKQSFIAEHMIFDKDIMREIISKIESKYNNEWFLAILDAISRTDLSGSGFSEFETYGTYVSYNYKEMYCYKKVAAVRNGKQIFGSIPSEKVLNWLSKKYDTISFEKKQERMISLQPYDFKWFRRICDPYIFITFINKMIGFKCQLKKIRGE